eukprot:CAMPEP_0169096936 /NCGR_PEP_ID=MMETSP1015-20121227/19258_1 /TAXON_ID=342587 /ORGANISM="Karlodinium micrum, Strain CCMP2283" /LENGTH=665 /DNA_ID=CAMNT_0009157721 /DNA_START=38 /DNA_END=2035 /DNA_ORIENTATION=-
MELDYRASQAELQAQILRLSEDHKELQEYAERVTRELRRYQQSRPTPSTRAEDDMPLPPWAMNMQMMSPLLLAYEERLAELEAVIDRSTSLAEQAQALAKENDALRVELQERAEQIRQLHAMPSLNSEGKDGAAEQHRELQGLYRLSIEQNEALAQQNQLLKVQLERMQSSIVLGQQQTQELQEQTLEGSRAVVAEKERADMFAQQRAVLERQLGVVNGELVEEIQVREQIARENEGLKLDIQAQTQRLESCKRSHEERYARVVDEGERLRAELERTSGNDWNQSQRIASLEIDLAKTSEQYAIKRQEADALRSDVEQCVREMDSMLGKLADVTQQYEDVRRKLGEQEAKASQLVLDRDRCAHSEVAAQRTLEKVQSRLQSEIDAMRAQRDLDVANLSSALSRDKEAREEKLRKSQEDVLQLQMKVELAEKQRAWDKASSESESSVYSAEKSRLHSELEEMHQARVRAERQAGAARSETGKTRSECEALVAESCEQREWTNSEIASCQKKVQLAERSTSNLRDELHQFELRNGMLVADQARLQAELQEERMHANDEATRERRKSLSERRALERQVQSLTIKSHQDEQRALDLVRSQENLEQQWRAELAVERNALEEEKDRLAADNRALREKSRNLLKTIASRRLGLCGEAEAEDDRILSALVPLR